MGLDLTLVPERWAPRGRPILGYCRVDLQGRDHHIYAEIAKRAVPLLPEVLLWYGDDGIEERTDDPHGKPLTFVNATDLGSILYRHRLKFNQWDKAVMYFVRQLPADNRIILWWH